MLGTLAAQRNNCAVERLLNRMLGFAFITGAVRGRQAGDVIAYDFGDRAHCLNRRSHVTDPHQKALYSEDSRIYSKAVQSKQCQLYPRGTLEHTSDEDRESFFT
jgi:hypothetical protein